MKIDRIDVIPFGIPIRKFADAYTGFSVSNAVLVKIYTNDGHVGYGEACAWEPEFYGETLESVSTTIEKYIAPKIIDGCVKVPDKPGFGAELDEGIFNQCKYNNL